MGSTRLPGKVLMDLEGETMLARVIERIGRAPGLDEIGVATTAEGSDDAIVAECERLGVQVMRGSTLDVLDRYFKAASLWQADAVVRITSDCPLLDSSLIGEAAILFWEMGADYVSNTLGRATYPRGLDVEVISIDALARAWREADAMYQRAHVTPYIYQHPEIFSLQSLRGEQDYSDYRWTVDTPEDLAFVRAIYQALGSSGRFGWRDVVQFLDAEPALKDINKCVKQKTLEEG
jgi:spore coat polysaccharide biosynthesis protein SpsF